jgi:hypothetical protein
MLDDFSIRADGTEDASCTAWLRNCRQNCKEGNHEADITGIDDASR